ncbi:MAG: flagellar hook assembly protein FlgD [Eubacteriales bacterium]
MAVNGVSNSGQQAVTDSVKKVMGKDDFLKLLITQLKYQDPLEPTDNKDFIAQMAQFSSLEQMTNMTDSVQKLTGMQESTLRELTVGQAVNLIGHTVSAVTPVDNVTGKINTEGTALYSGADKTTMVLAALAKNTPVTILGKEGSMTQVKLANGATGYVEQTSLTPDEIPRIIGVATGMKIVDGVPNVIINGKDIPLSYVEEVNITLPVTGGDAASTP